MKSNLSQSNILKKKLETSITIPPLPKINTSRNPNYLNNNLSIGFMDISGIESDNSRIFFDEMIIPRNPDGLILLKKKLNKLNNEINDLKVSCLKLKYEKEENKNFLVEAQKINNSLKNSVNKEKSNFEEEHFNISTSINNSNTINNNNNINNNNLNHFSKNNLTYFEEEEKEKEINEEKNEEKNEENIEIDIEEKKENNKNNNNNKNTESIESELKIENETKNELLTKIEEENNEKKEIEEIKNNEEEKEKTLEENNNSLKNDDNKNIHKKRSSSMELIPSNYNKIYSENILNKIKNKNIIFKLKRKIYDCVEKIKLNNEEINKLKSKSKAINFKGQNNELFKLINQINYLTSRNTEINNIIFPQKIQYNENSNNDFLFHKTVNKTIKEESELLNQKYQILKIENLKSNRNINLLDEYNNSIKYQLNSLNQIEKKKINEFKLCESQIEQINFIKEDIQMKNYLKENNENEINKLKEENNKKEREIYLLEDEKNNYFVEIQKKRRINLQKKNNEKEKINKIKENIKSIDKKILVEKKENKSLIQKSQYANYNQHKISIFKGEEVNYYSKIKNKKK